MARTHDIEVHGFHCDLYGHVNNARYLEFLEAARWKALDGALDVDAWHARGWLFVIAHIDIAYRAAATLGDRLTVHTWQGEFSRRSAKVNQRVVNETGKIVADAKVTYVILDRDSQRPLPLDGEIRDGLEALAADAPVIGDQSS